jgi:hypothetical protein
LTTLPSTPAGGGTTSPPTGKAVVNANGLCLDDKSSGTGKRQPDSDLGLQRHGCATVDVRSGRKHAARSGQVRRHQEWAARPLAPRCSFGTATTAGAQVWIPPFEREYYNPQSNRLPRHSQTAPPPGVPRCRFGIATGAQRWTLPQ